MHLSLSSWAIVAVAVTGVSQAADPPPVRFEEVMVTATRFRDRYVDQPVNVSVITAEDIRQSAAKTVPDLLSEQAGIEIHDLYGNNAAATTVDLRGFGISGTQNTLILIDGRRASDIDLSSVQWSAVPLGAIERIEIVRGGGAVMYGAGATAGVINIITKSPTTLGNGITVQTKAGSYATTETQVNANYFGSRSGFNVIASNYESNGYRDNNHNRQSNVLGDFRFLTEDGDLTLKLGTDSQGMRLPGARTVQPSAGVNQLETDRRGAQTPLDYAQRDGNRATLDWRQDAGFGEFIIGAGYRDKKQTSYFDFGGYPDYRVADLDVWSFTPRVKIARPLFGQANTLVAGFDWYHWNYGLQRSDSVANIGQPFNTVAATQENAAFYLHNTTRLGERTTLNTGVRRERFRIDASDAFNPAAPGGAYGSGAPSGAQKETEYAYELGVRHQLYPAVAVIGKTGRSYRFANVDEIYESTPSYTNQFQFLQPQTAYNYELGMEANVTHARLRASVFIIDVNDEIHLDPFTSGVGNTNLPPSRRSGFELEGKWSGWKTLVLGASYSYTDARFRDGAFTGGGGFLANQVISGKTVPLVPRHKLNVSASWAMGPQTRLNAMLAHVGEQYMDNDEANTLGVQIPAYTVADLKLVHHSGAWTLSGTINNLLNEKYYNYAVRSGQVPDRYNAYPLPERSMLMMLEYAFK